MNYLFCQNLVQPNQKLCLFPGIFRLTMDKTENCAQQGRPPTEYNDEHCHVQLRGNLKIRLQSHDTVASSLPLVLFLTLLYKSRAFAVSHKHLRLPETITFVVLKEF